MLAQKFITFLKYFLLSFPAIFLLAGIYGIYRKAKDYVIGKLEYSRTFSESEVVEGECVIITEVISNPTFIPMFFIDVLSYIHSDLKIDGRVADETEGMQEVISRFHMLPFSRTTRRHKVVCTHRGFYSMNTAAVINKARTWEFNKVFKFNEELYVFPKQTAYPYTRRSLNMSQGTSISANKAVLDPFSMIGIRNYNFGDPFNRINFKATARCSHLGIRGIKVNDLDACSDRIIMLFINFQSPKDYNNADAFSQRMEYALSVASEIVGDAERNGYKIGFAANCQSSSGENHVWFPITSGQNQTREISREIAKINVRCTCSFYTLLRNEIKSDLSMTEVIIITPCIDDDLDKGASFLKKRNSVEVIQV